MALTEFKLNYVLPESYPPLKEAMALSVYLSIYTCIWEREKDMAKYKDSK